VAVERSLHVFVERQVQDAAGAIPGLPGTLGLLYLTLHLAVTGCCLIWLHRRHPSAFPFVRTTLVLASGLALIGYVFFPTAPPRLAGIGVADTISNGHVDLNKGLISSLYNPVAAVPSMHAGYAVIVGATLLRVGSGRAVRLAGALYPVLVLVVIVIVATGNHFLLDAVMGLAVAGVAAAATALLDRSRATSDPDTLGDRLAMRPATQRMRAEPADRHARPMRGDAHPGPTDSRDHPQRELDELVLELKGLVEARALLESRGASAAEVASHAAEIDRLRARLATHVQGAGNGYGAAA
jgi:PAP2 superfamily